MSAQPCCRYQASNRGVCGIHQADNRSLTTSGRRRCSYTFSVMMCCLMGPPERSSMCKPYQIAPSLSCSPCFSAADQTTSAIQQIDVVMGTNSSTQSPKHCAGNLIVTQAVCISCRQPDHQQHTGSHDSLVHAVTAEADTDVRHRRCASMVHCSLHDMFAHARSKPCIVLCVDSKDA